MHDARIVSVAYHAANLNQALVGLTPCLRAILVPSADDWTPARWSDDITDWNAMLGCNPCENAVKRRASHRKSILADADRFLERVKLASRAKFVHAGLQFDRGMSVVLALMLEPRRLANG